ncbi:hypothetical protein C8Q73DRAFT_793820 [Cubamyces lactineus]|nr:hypothetical protein C8Q73DRAFT_793820 [Cubamyces lactineus]
MSTVVHTVALDLSALPDPIADMHGLRRNGNRDLLLDLYTFEDASPGDASPDAMDPQLESACVDDSPRRASTLSLSSNNTPLRLVLFVLFVLLELIVFATLLWLMLPAFAFLLRRRSFLVEYLHF